PFFNLSQERAVDGHRFALAYFSELQKMPGFQVVPVGIAEQAVADNRLDMNDPADALRLADILGVDAADGGAVTDYDPYYPPRIGLQVSWYSPSPWTFFAGIPTDPRDHKRWKEALKEHKRLQKELESQIGRRHPGDGERLTVVRGQSAELSQA